MEMKKYKLGEILYEFHSGESIKSSEIYDTGKYPVFGANGIRGYVDRYNQDSSITIIGRQGAYCGNVKYFSGKAFYTEHAVIAKPKEFVDAKYLSYILPFYQLNKYQGQSAQPGLSVNTLSRIEIEIPSLIEQKKIIAVLSSFDDKITLNNRINAKLEQMAKRLYDYWFVQFDFPGADGTVGERSRTKPYKSNGGKMVWNEELKRDIPEGWEVKKLGSLFTTNRGVSYSTATITGDGGIPMINLASFSPDGSYKISGLKKFTGEYTEEKVIKPYDLVLCNTQQTAIDFSKDIIGKVLLVPDIFEGDIISSHHVNTLHVCDEDLKFYLYRLCNTDYFHKYISNYASGTNILGLDFSGVENFKAEIPPAALLNQFAKLMLNIEKKKSEVIKENQKLTAMRDKLLPLLMNGQVVVEEDENFL